MTTHPALRPLTLAVLSGLGSLGVLGASPAQAQSTSPASDEPYFFGGLSVGHSLAKIDEPRIIASQLGAGLSTTAFSRDESDTGYKLFGGYQFSRHWGLEAGYFNLGSFGFRSITSPAGTLDGKIQLRGLHLDLVGNIPLSQHWSATGRVGVQRARARDQFTATGAVSVLHPNPSQSDTLAKVGVGLQYAVSSSLLLRADAERYRVNDAVGNRGDVNLFSVSLVFPFGLNSAPQAPPPRRVAAATPAPLQAVAASPPAPMAALAPVVVPVAVAPPPPRRRVSFSAEKLFGFDQAAVSPQGQVALDGFLQELQGTDFDQILVVGHTDRLGTEAYNQKLSVRRADAVKDYLVSAGRLSPTRVSAIGQGEAESVTQGSCPGSRADARLIACLQPDRRVVVEVTGTR